MVHTELILSLVLLVAIVCQWVAWRVRLPAILFLLIAGMVLGPVGHWLEPDALLGDLLMPMVSLSVAIILFEGSLTLRAQEIREIGTVVKRMISVGALVTWVVAAIGARLIMDMSWAVSALFGAIVIVTGPTVIVPMLRSVRPKAKLGNILRWEGIAIDPVGALMAVLAYEFILASADEAAIGRVLVVFLQSVAAGGVLGIVAGFVLGALLSRNWMPEYLQNLATLSLVLLTFSVSNAVQHESGLLAVTVMGVWLANRPQVDIRPILNFKEHLSLLLISVLFIMLAARIDLNQLLDIGWKALLMLAVLQFIARPLKVWVSTLGTSLNWRERGLLAWIAPRGIVAAAISAIFAEKLVAAGYEDAALLVPLTFSMIVGTVVLQSGTARFVARALGVAEPPPKGFLIIGANPFSIALAKQLTQLEVRCVIVDANWENVRQARMEGLETFYGNPVSDYVDTHLDLSGLRGMLALSRQRHVNQMSVVHYRADFKDKHIYSLMNTRENSQLEKHRLSINFSGRTLFGKDIGYFDLVALISRKMRFRSTTLTDEFDWQTYQQRYAEKRLPLVVISENGIATPYTVDQSLEPQEGDTILALSLNDEEESEKLAQKAKESADAEIPSPATEAQPTTS